MLARKYFPKGRFWGILLAMSTATDILIIQPPLVQLNTPYPAGAYLKSFFQSEVSVKSEREVQAIFRISCRHKVFTYTRGISCRVG